MFYNIFHCYDVDGGFGDAVHKRECVATVKATEKQIDNFIKEWNKPRIYERPYSCLYEHSIRVEKIEIKDINSVIPYDPETKDWPDIPEDAGWDSTYDTETKKWIERSWDEECDEGEE